jgi:hypothetical protein
MTATAIAIQPEQNNHLAELIAAHEERVGILRIQAARMGTDTPPHITIEIEKIIDELAHLKQASTYPVSPALMEELGPAGRSQLWMSHIMRLDADIGRVARDLRELRGHDLRELREHLDERIDELQAQLNLRLDNLIFAIGASQPAAKPARSVRPISLDRRAKAGR